MLYSVEFWTEFAIEEEASSQGIGVATAGLRDGWQALVNQAAREATLTSPVAIKAPAGTGAKTNAWPQGKHGDHSPHLVPLLAEMQSLARQHPGGTW